MFCRIPSDMVNEMSSRGIVVCSFISEDGVPFLGAEVPEAVASELGLEAAPGVMPNAVSSDR